jgi:hypothetical protein
MHLFCTPQMVFCSHHDVPYDPSWTRGAVNDLIDRHIIQVRRAQCWLQGHVGFAVEEGSAKLSKPSS